MNTVKTLFDPQSVLLAKYAKFREKSRNRSSLGSPGGHARQLKDLSLFVPRHSIFGVRWLDTAFPGGGAAIPRIVQLPCPDRSGDVRQEAGSTGGKKRRPAADTPKRRGRRGQGRESEPLLSFYFQYRNLGGMIEWAGVGNGSSGLGFRIPDEILGNGNEFFDFQIPVSA